MKENPSLRSHPLTLILTIRVDIEIAIRLKQLLELDQLVN